MEKILLQCFSNPPVCCLLLTCVICLIYRKRFASPISVFVYYLWFNLFIEIAATWAAITYKNNLPLLHLYTLGEFLILTYFYKLILRENSLLKKYFWPIIVTGTGWIIVNSLVFETILEFNPRSKTPVQIFLILCALDFAFSVKDEIPGTKEERQVESTLHGINTAVLIYYLGSLFIFAFSEFTLGNPEYGHIFQTLNQILNLGFQVIALHALCRLIFQPQASFG